MWQAIKNKKWWWINSILYIAINSIWGALTFVTNDSIYFKIGFGLGIALTIYVGAVVIIFIALLFKRRLFRTNWNRKFYTALKFDLIYYLPFSNLISEEEFSKNNYNQAIKNNQIRRFLDINFLIWGTVFLGTILLIMNILLLVIDSDILLKFEYFSNLKERLNNASLIFKAIIQFIIIMYTIGFGYSLTKRIDEDTNSRIYFVEVQNKLKKFQVISDFIISKKISKSYLISLFTNEWFPNYIIQKYHENNISLVVKEIILWNKFLNNLSLIQIISFWGFFINWYDKFNNRKNQTLLVQANFYLKEYFKSDDIRNDLLLEKSKLYIVTLINSNQKILNKRKFNYLKIILLDFNFNIYDIWCEYERHLSFDEKINFFQLNYIVFIMNKYLK